MKARSSFFLFFLAIAIAFLIATPILSVGLNLFVRSSSGTWAHLAETVLGEYISNSLILCLGVAVGVALLGVSTAWLTTMHRFPGQKVFQWALILPLAMPAYVMAYVYTDFLQFVGPVQTALREWMGWSYGDYWFPDVRTLSGAVLMFAFVLYPYVYLLARTAFLERAGGVLEVARSLGMGSLQGFWKLSLPLARPAIVAGVGLALMETLADYGTVAYFGVNTFTTGIYRAWFSLGDKTAAAQLASVLLGFVFLLLSLEYLSRGRARYHNTSLRLHASQRRRLSGWQAKGAVLVCFLPLFFGFLLPAGLLLKMAWLEGDASFGLRFIQLAKNSFTLASLAAVCAIGVAVLLAYAARLSGGPWVGWLNRSVGLGYAIPGTVIAVGILIPVTWLDKQLAEAWQVWTGQPLGLLLTGGVAALIYAYLVRFLGVALQGIEASLSKVTRNMDDAARCLGRSQWQTLWQVHLPLIRSSILTAGLLVFVDVMKELPATLVMRPFNFDTLATQAFVLASDERLAEASTAALAIVVVGLLPLILISQQIVKHPNASSGQGVVC